MKHNATTLLAVLAGFALLAPASAAQGADGAGASMSPVVESSLAWSDVDLPGFLPGMRLSVVHGDPESAGPYTLRLAFPDGYRFPPHWHPQPENLTVLSGTFFVAMGSKADDSRLKEYAPGDFIWMPPEKPHFGEVRGETIVQLHGVGPFQIHVVEGQEMTAQ